MREKNMWLRFDELPRKFLRAYRHNIAVRCDLTENTLPNGAIIFQSGGAFPKLRFRRARMSFVCCEVLAAYNAMTLSGIKTELLKLSAEFECGAAFPAFPPGVFGSDPRKICRCLAAHGARFAEFASIKEAERSMREGQAGIIGYRYGRFDPRIHTFAVQKNADGFTAYNRFSNHRKPLEALSLRDTLYRENRKPIVISLIVVSSARGNAEAIFKSE